MGLLALLKKRNPPEHKVVSVALAQKKISLLEEFKQEVAHLLSLLSYSTSHNGYYLTGGSGLSQIKTTSNNFSKLKTKYVQKIIKSVQQIEKDIADLRGISTPFAQREKKALIYISSVGEEIHKACEDVDCAVEALEESIKTPTTTEASYKKYKEYIELALSYLKDAETITENILEKTQQVIVLEKQLEK